MDSLRLTAQPEFRPAIAYEGPSRGRWVTTLSPADFVKALEDARAEGRAEASRPPASGDAPERHPITWTWLQAAVTGAWIAVPLCCDGDEDEEPDRPCARRGFKCCQPYCQHFAPKDAPVAATPPPAPEPRVSTQQRIPGTNLPAVDPPPAPEAGLLAPILGLKITAGQIEDALNTLGPSGNRAEAYVKAAAQAAADVLRLTLAPADPTDE